MKPDKSKAEFKRFTKANGVNPLKSSVQEGFGQMFDFFKTTKIDGCYHEDGDMLLFQWGTYERNGKRLFTIDLTRQFYEIKRGEFAGASHLSLAYHFDAAPDFDLIGGGSRWLHGADDVDEFIDFVMNTDALAAIVRREIKETEFFFSYV